MEIPIPGKDRVYTKLGPASFEALWVTSRSLIRSSDNDSTGFWPPGSLHTLGADGHI